MVSLGLQMAFFFICFLSTAISYSVSLNHGWKRLPGKESFGGGESLASALLVEIPATWLCTFVPMVPVGRGREGFGTLMLLLFGILMPLWVDISMPDPDDEPGLEPSHPESTLGVGDAREPKVMTFFLLRSRGLDVVVCA
jgi:hypothetical protein